MVLITTHNIIRVICYIDETFEPGNSLNLAVTAVVGQHSRVTVQCYPLDLIDFEILRAERFWRETVSLLDFLDLEVTNESARC